MKTRSLFTMALIIGCFSMAKAIDLPETELIYNVQYKWGFIDVAIGNATTHISINNNNLSGTLAGQSIPWDGRIFSIGDTLQSLMNPTSQVNQYINGWYRKPHVDKTVDVNDPQNYKTIHGNGTLSASGSTMEAVTITAQMIGLYYYAQVLDFDSMQSGQKTVIQISGGGLDPETLVITYKGREQCSDQSAEDYYEIVFEYSYQGEMSNYPVICHIRTSDRIPDYFGADLKIGHVDMYLN